MRRGLTGRQHRQVIDVAAIRSLVCHPIAVSWTSGRAGWLPASEAKPAAGYGGIAAASVATAGVARSTIGRGLAELTQRHDDQPSRVRRPGAGRKPATTKQPGLLAALQELVSGAIRGDPEAALLWVSRSQRHLAEALSERGFTVSHKLVGRLLAGLGFSLQAPTTRRVEGSYIIRTAMPSSSTSMPGSRRSRPRSSRRFRSTPRRRSLLATLRTAAGNCGPRGDPRARCGCTTSRSRPLGRARCPTASLRYAPPDTLAGSAWGSTMDTAAFAVESIRRWWHELGQSRYPRAKRLLITADCGGSNGARVRLWKWELQKLANEIGVAITVAHLPPWHEQVEPDRAPDVRLHHSELARQAVGQPPGDRATDRRNYHQDWVERCLAASMTTSTRRA